MVETLTESFCERCGTRYEFKAPTRLNPLRKTRGLFGGLKNYLTSQDALSDAIGDAMRTEEDQLASAQLEAFHESFNFCISCRQYTCLNCWNDGEGRCRSCAPIPGTDDLAERLAASLNAGGAQAVAEAPLVDAVPELSDADLQRRLGAEAWPTVDAPAAESPATAGSADAWPVADDLARWGEGTPAGDPAEDSPWRTPFNEPVAADAVAEPAWDEPIAADAGPSWQEAATADVHPDEPLLAEIDIDEPAAEAEAEPDAEPVAAHVEPEPERVVAEVVPEFEPAVADIEPVVADFEAEPEPIAAEFTPAAEPAWPDVPAEPVEPVLAEEPPPRILRVLAWDDDVPEGHLLRAEPEPEPIVSEVELDAEPVVAEVEPEAEPVVAEQAPDEPAAAEMAPEPVVAEAEPELEPVVAEAEPEPEPIAAEREPEPEPDSIAAAAEPLPETRTPRPAPIRIAPIRETILRLPDRPVPEPTTAPLAAEQDSPEVAARRAQLDLLGLGDPGQGPVTPERPVVMPYRSRGAPGGGEIAARAGGSGFWEASAREVAGAAANIGVQNCGQCGLSLSANARFCRRCGTRQAQSA